MATTLAQLRTAFEFRWDVAGSTVLSTSEKNTLINSGYRALWAEVTGVNKFFRNTVDTFSITSGQTRALPADFQETTLVRKDPNTDNMVILTKYGPKTGSQQYTRTYRLDNTNLIIEPLQRAPGNYDHHYIPQSPVLANDSDQLDTELDQWRDYIIAYAVIEALVRENSQEEAAGFFRILYGTPGDPNDIGIKGKVLRWAAGQRSSDPDTIEDVRRYQPWMWTPP